MNTFNSRDTLVSDNFQIFVRALAIYVLIRDKLNNMLFNNISGDNSDEENMIPSSRFNSVSSENNQKTLFVGTGKIKTYNFNIFC